MRGLAAFVMRGQVQAVGIASASALLSLLVPLVSFLGVIGAAVVALVTLRLGWRQGVAVLAFSTAVVVLLGGSAVQYPPLVVGYALLLWIPIWLTAGILRQTRQLSLALEGGLVLAAGAVIGLYLWYPDPGQAWENRLRDILEAVAGGAPSQAGAMPLMDNLEVIARWMTGVMAAGSLMSLVLALLLARWWQAVLYNPGGFREEFVGMRVHNETAYACALLIVATILGGGFVRELAQNLLVLFLVLYIFVGLAIMHALLGQSRLKQVALTILYLILAVVPQSLLPVALIGFTDTWVNWRRAASQA